MSGIIDSRYDLYKRCGQKKCLNFETESFEKRSEIIGKFLTRFRLKKRFTQRQVSEEIGIAQQTYAGYEKGKHEPSIEILIRLADLYGVSLDLITGRYLSTDLNFIIDAALGENIEITQQDKCNEVLDELDELALMKNPDLVTVNRQRYNRAKKE